MNPLVGNRLVDQPQILIQKMQKNITEMYASYFIQNPLP